MNMRKTGIGVGIAVLATAGIWAITRVGRQSIVRADEIGGDSPSPVAVDVMTVKQSEMPAVVEATGTVKAELDSSLGTKIMGRIVDIMVREGDTVHKGQVLATIDSRDLDAAVKQAGAGLHAATVTYDNARTSASMEDAMSKARISDAEARVKQANAGVQEATARLQALQSGPRRQERAQASLAVVQAKANLDLAKANLRRMDNLVNQGAISRQQYDITKTSVEVAKAQYDASVQQKDMSNEGSRLEDIKAAEDALSQAKGLLDSANAGLRQAQASALQVTLRREEIKGAKAQIGVSQASLRMATVARDYGVVTAPFDGVVTARMVDPGAMANAGASLIRIQGGQIRLEAVVPESVLKYVHVGSTLPVKLDALSGGKVQGRIVETAPQGDPGSHTFVVKIALPAESQARAGMFGRAIICTNMDKRILVPSTAVVEREGLHYVYAIDKKNMAHLRLVTVGNLDGTMLPLLSGVNVGERIATNNLDSIRDGRIVDIK